MKKTNVQIDTLINWRKVSKLISESRSETAIRRNECPKKYLKEIEGLEVALQSWVKEFIFKEKPVIKYSAEEIKNKLNTVEW
jgi:hypothetical protein